MAPARRQQDATSIGCGPDFATERPGPDVGEITLPDHGLCFALYSPMKNHTKETAQPALQRDPDEWKTGDEPMTDAQRSYLETLCRETGEEFDESLSKADASKRIDELRDKSPRLSNG